MKQALSLLSELHGIGMKIGDGHITAAVYSLPQEPVCSISTRTRY